MSCVIKACVAILPLRDRLVAEPNLNLHLTNGLRGAILVEVHYDMAEACDTLGLGPEVALGIVRGHIAARLERNRVSGVHLRPAEVRHEGDVQRSTSGLNAGQHAECHQRNAGKKGL
tara:strand:- start:543 stop:893 length:351 start_codon:yes stop_codon:yes gene_type:complete